VAITGRLTEGHRLGVRPVGCTPNLDVPTLHPAAQGALMIGECDTPREDTLMLWFLGPRSRRRGAAGNSQVAAVDCRWPHVGAAAVAKGASVRISLFGLIYLAIGVVVALTNGYNSVAGVSEILSLVIAIVLWPAVLFGVDLHLPAIAT
jgi:hypothetical protein